MPIDAVVVNASPLIALFRSGLHELLPRQFHSRHRSSGVAPQRALCALVR
jgi:hypothetical protein